MAGANKGDALRVKLRGDILSFPVAASTRIMRGTMVAMDISVGAAVQCGDDANHRFVGIAEEEVNIAAGATGTIKVRRHGIFRMVKEAATAATDVGKLAYVAEAHVYNTTDELVDLAAAVSTPVAVGLIVQRVEDTPGSGTYDSKYLMVDITPSPWQNTSLTAHTQLVDGTAHKYSGIDPEEVTTTGDTTVTIANMRKGVLSFSKNGAQAITLAAPVAADDGMRIVMIKTGTVGVVTVTTTTVTIAGASTFVGLREPGDSAVFVYDHDNTDLRLVSHNLSAQLEAGATADVSLDEMRQGVVFCSNNGACVVTLATPTNVDDGLRCTFVKTGTPGVMSFKCTGAELIDNKTVFFHLANKYDAVELIWNGAGWVVGMVKEKLLGHYEFLDDFIEHTYLVTDWDVTEQGAGSEATFDILGGALKVTCAAADNDASQHCHKIEAFDFGAAKPFYFECKFRYSDGGGAADAIELLIGLIANEDLKAEDPLTVVTDGVYIKIDDGDHNIDFMATKNTADTAHAAETTLVEATWMTIGLLWDCTDLKLFVDGVESANVIAAANCPAAATLLAPFFMVRNGEAVAKVLDVDYIYCKQLR